MGTKIATKHYWIICRPLDRIDSFWQEDKKLYREIAPLLGMATTTRMYQTRMYHVSLDDLRSIFKLITQEYDAVQHKLDTKSLAGDRAAALTERFVRLREARNAVIASVDARSRKNVLGIVTPITHEKAEKLEDDKTYTVFIHTLNNQPAVFLGDRIVTLDGDLKFKNAKGTKYETPTSLTQIKSQLRLARKCMVESGQYTREEILAFDTSWGWVSYKIRGNKQTIERKSAEAK